MLRACLLLTCLGFVTTVNADEPKKLEKSKIYLFTPSKPGDTKIADDWTEIKPYDASVKKDDKQYLLYDDVMIHATALSIAEVYKGQPAPSHPPGVAVRLEITCTNKDQKRMCYKWSTTKISDDKGNKYEQYGLTKPSPLALLPRGYRMDGETLIETLIFERPVASAKELFLELPGSGVGLKSNFKFKLTTETVKAAQEIKKK